MSIVTKKEHISGTDSSVVDYTTLPVVVPQNKELEAKLDSEANLLTVTDSNGYPPNFENISRMELTRLRHTIAALEQEAIAKGF